MAKYKIAWLEKKSDEWQVASLESGEKEVSINRKSKKGDVFPDFDNLKAGTEVEGELWQSPAGKWYLFPPRPVSEAPRGSGGAFKAQQIEKHESEKRGFIKEVIGEKERSIQIAAAERDAVLIVTTFYKATWQNDPILEGELDELIKRKVVYFRDWFLSKDFTETIPF